MSTFSSLPMLSIPNLPPLPSIPGTSTTIPAPVPPPSLPTADTATSMPSIEPSIPSLTLPSISAFTLNAPAAVIPAMPVSLPTAPLPTAPIVAGGFGTSGVIRIVKDDRPTGFSIVNLDGMSSLSPKKITITWVSPVFTIDGNTAVYPGWTAMPDNKQCVTCTIARFIACSKIPTKYLTATGGLNADFFSGRYNKLTTTTGLGGGKGRRTDSIQQYYCDGRIFTERQFFAYVIGPVYVQAVERLSEFISLQTNLEREGLAIKSKAVLVNRTVPTTLEDATAAFNDETTPFGLEDALGLAIRGFKPWA